MAFTPAADAPSTAAMEASSSSICRKCPPTCGRRSALCSAISVDGVMGYPAKKRIPAAMAPSTAASLPCIRTAFDMSSPSSLFDIDKVDRVIRAAQLALTAADACFRSLDAHLFVLDLQNLFGAEGGADPAALAPGRFHDQSLSSDHIGSPFPPRCTRGTCSYLTPFPGKRTTLLSMLLPQDFSCGTMLDGSRVSVRPEKGDLP